MKRIIHTALCAVAAALVSCDGDIPGALYTGTGGFSFQSSVLNIETGAEDNNRLMIPVYRSATAENIANVSFEVLVAKDAGNGAGKDEYVGEDPSGLFTFITPRVVFADGESVAYAQIAYTDLESLGLTRKHKLRLTLTDTEGLSPAGKSVVEITANRKLTYKRLGKGTYNDQFMFENVYDVEIYKAEEADVYRVMDPYSEGLVAEEYVENGYATTPSPYVQIVSDPDGTVYYEPFYCGMFHDQKYPVMAYHPIDYGEMNYEEYIARNCWSEDRSKITLYPMFLVPDYGTFFFSPIEITMPAE